MKHGEICWRETVTEDLEKSKDFYQKLLGWELEKSKIPDVEYVQINVGGNAVGGMIEMDEKWGDPLPPSHWITYIAVDDVAATVEKVKENGGKICVEPSEVPNVGTISMIYDPSGAVFAIMQAADFEQSTQEIFKQENFFKV